jgi:hypothetical protein
MRSLFALFNTPVDLGHRFFSPLFQDGDVAIDATCGNGKDSLVLAGFLSRKKHTSLLCIDIQEIAVRNTEKLLQKEASEFLPFVTFETRSHETFPKDLKGSVKLVIYNLGYLPGSDKTLTTKVSSTLTSVTNAMNILAPGGVINITCYPGHPEGALEEAALTEFLSTLDPALWSVTGVRFHNRKASPSVLLLQKSLQMQEKK